MVPSVYSAFWRTPRWRWWRLVIAVPVSCAAFILLTWLLQQLAIWVDDITGRRPRASVGSGTAFTPVMHIANNLATAGMILIAMLVGTVIFRQPNRWLTSVTGRLRWRWVGVCLLAFLPVGLAEAAFEWGRAGSLLRVGPDTPLWLAGIVLTTPLQCAGEEFGFRGVVNRGFASLLPNQVAGAVLGGVVSSGLFMLAHGVGDIWLNTYYFGFGLLACYLVWLTGALEASIAMHVVNNLAGQSTLPFLSSFSVDRSAGSGSPLILGILGVQLLCAALITVIARRRGVSRQSAPGAVPIAKQASESAG